MIMLSFGNHLVKDLGVKTQWRASKYFSYSLKRPLCYYWQTDYGISIIASCREENVTKHTSHRLEISTLMNILSSDNTPLKRTGLFEADTVKISAAETWATANLN